MSPLKLTLQDSEQIAYFRGANNYCWLHFRQGETKLVAKTLGYLQAQLPDFIRVHKTVLINRRYISRLRYPPRPKTSGAVYLESGEVFPVSRRRWHYVLDRVQNQPAAVAGDHHDLAKRPTPLVRPPVVSRPPNSTTPSIVLVSDDKEKVQRLEHLIEQQWSAYQLKAVQAASLLMDVLSQSAVSDYPTLILVDAQTKTYERLRLLRALKQSRSLRQIPVILFIPPNDQLIVEGYEYQANSVILLADRYTLVEELVGRVLHYWLEVVALPRIYVD